MVILVGWVVVAVVVEVVLGVKVVPVEAIGVNFVLEEVSKYDGGGGGDSSGGEVGSTYWGGGRRNASSFFPCLTSKLNPLA